MARIAVGATGGVLALGFCLGFLASSVGPVYSQFCVQNTCKNVFCWRTKNAAFGTACAVLNPDGVSYTTVLYGWGDPNNKIWTNTKTPDGGLVNQQKTYIIWRYTTLTNACNTLLVPGSGIVECSGVGGMPTVNSCQWQLCVTS